MNRRGSLRYVASRIAFAIAMVASSAGCARAPSALAPAYHGSIGLPHRGVLTGASELRQTPVVQWLRPNDRHYGVARLGRAIEHAAAFVEAERPGSVLVVGDLSTKEGGALSPHFSHRSGRDADLLLYLTTLEGVPVRSPGFVHVGPDGLARDEAHHRYLRFDVEREWLLVKSLVEDPEARVQWIFANHAVEAMLVRWARARGEPSETILRAMDVLLEPKPGGEHDDHVHVRTACAPSELAEGCEPSGPERPWLTDRPVMELPSTRDLVLDILRPLDSTEQRVAAHE